MNLVPSPFLGEGEGEGWVPARWLARFCSRWDRIRGEGYSRNKHDSLASDELAVRGTRPSLRKLPQLPCPFEREIFCESLVFGGWSVTRVIEVADLVQQQMVEVVALYLIALPSKDQLSGALFPASTPRLVVLDRCLCRSPVPSHTEILWKCVQHDALKVLASFDPSSVIVLGQTLKHDSANVRCQRFRQPIKYRKSFGFRAWMEVVARWILADDPQLTCALVRQLLLCRVREIARPLLTSLAILGPTSLGKADLFASSRWIAHPRYPRANPYSLTTFSAMRSWTSTNPTGLPS